MPLDSFRQVFLPYCVVLNDDRTFSVLNREYHDVGYPGPKYPPGYEPRRYRMKGLGTKSLDAIAWTPSKDGKQWFLYNDGCTPDSSPAAWAAYSKRLRGLCRLSAPSGQTMVVGEE